MSFPTFLSVADVAEVLYVSKMTVYRMVENGDLPALKINKRTYRIRQEDLDAYIAANMTRS
mgnify:CR=1 FL=1